jgi:hypothetical protein
MEAPATWDLLECTQVPPSLGTLCPYVLMSSPSTLGRDAIWVVSKRQASLQYLQYSGGHSCWTVPKVGR